MAANGFQHLTLDKRRSLFRYASAPPCEMMVEKRRFAR